MLVKFPGNEYFNKEITSSFCTSCMFICSVMLERNYRRCYPQFLDHVFFIIYKLHVAPARSVFYQTVECLINPLKPELNPICYLLALLGAHHFLHVSRIRVKILTLRRLMSYIYGAPILDVSRSHTTTQHSR